MKTIDLVLKAEWYDMIASGEKREEYREIKSYWSKRIMKCHKWCGRGRYITTNVFHCLLPNRCENTMNFHSISGGYTHVRFRRGYTHTAMLFRIDNIAIGRGKPEWGAPDHDVFIIRLGERI